MSTHELDDWRGLLLARQAELGNGLRKRNGIAVEQTPDALDAVLMAAERDFAVRQLDREAALSREIAAALDRIDDGSFGHCTCCGEPLGPKRLAAAPWAACCRDCQEIAEARLGGPAPRWERLLPDAA